MRAFERILFETKQKMRGYKGMDKNMQCRGTQYKVGESYHIDGHIGICERGFHFCKELYDVVQFYPRANGNRFFEVEASGRVIEGGDKCVASDLKIVRELTEIEVSRRVYSDGFIGYFHNHGLARIGFGDGAGVGNGYGDGYGNALGNGYCDGNGYGDGVGNGDGNGRGDSYTSDNIYRILKFE